MRERKIFITDTDRDRLEKLLLGTRMWSSRDKEHLQARRVLPMQAGVLPVKAPGRDGLSARHDARPAMDNPCASEPPHAGKRAVPPSSPSGRLSA